MSPHRIQPQAVADSLKFPAAGLLLVHSPLVRYGRMSERTARPTQLTHRADQAVRPRKIVHRRSVRRPVQTKAGMWKRQGFQKRTVPPTGAFQ